MNNSLLNWLRLREPSDNSARSEDLANKIAGITIGKKPVHVLDLATGTGSNLRYLAPRLPDRQRWLIVDRNQELLSKFSDLTSSWCSTHNYDVRTSPNGLTIRGTQLECHIETRCMDLSILDDDRIFKGRHLVTASALLDLVSAQWLHTVAARSRAAGAVVLFALTYTGRSFCSPSEPEDDLIRNLLNQHQRRDQGLGGPATGLTAVGCAIRCFEEVGYRVQIVPSDWILDPAKKELQRQLVKVWAKAATEMAPEDIQAIEDWTVKRLHHIDANLSHIIVGHLDMAAWLPLAQRKGMHGPS